MSEMLSISLTQQPFMEYLLCALHDACQFQKKQKCMRPDPYSQDTYNVAGKINCVYKSPYVLQREDYSGSKERCCKG